MECLVCGKIYEGGECPRCQFPDVQIPGLPEERERAIAKLKPAIDAYRTTFLQTISVDIVCYHWKDRDGQVVLECEKRIPLGKGTELLQREKWLSQKFARIPDQKQLPVTLCITAGESTTRKTVTIPNLQRAELQQIGAEMNQDCKIRLLLRNDTDKPTCSKFVPLF